MDAEVKKYLDRMDKRWNDKLNSIVQILEGQKKESWITANQLHKQYGIDSRLLYRLRANGQIEFKRTEKRSWLYKLESVPENLIK